MTNQEIIDKINELTKYRVNSDADGETLHFYTVKYNSKVKSVLKEICNEFDELKLEDYPYEGIVNLVDFLQEINYLKWRSENKLWWFDGNEFILYDEEDYPLNI